MLLLLLDTELTTEVAGVATTAVGRTGAAGGGITFPPCCNLAAFARSKASRYESGWAERR